MKKENNFIQSINLLGGVVTYNDFDIDETLPFENQECSYKEDILQIDFGERFTLDVGWYPEMNSKGHFLVRAILDRDWFNPLSKIKCRTLSDLKKAIEKTALLITEKQKIKGLPYRNIEY